MRPRRRHRELEEHREGERADAKRDCRKAEADEVADDDEDTSRRKSTRVVHELRPSDSGEP